MDNVKAKPSETTDAPQFVVRDLFGILGVSFHIAWGISVLFSPILFSLFSNPAEILFAKEVFMFASLVMVIIQWCLSYFNLQNKGLLIASIAIAAMSPLAVLYDYYGSMPAIELALWFLTGLGTTLLLVFWGSFLSGLEHKKAIAYPACSFIIAGLIICLGSVLIRPANYILIALLPWLSIAAYYAERKTRTSAPSKLMELGEHEKGSTISPLNPSLLRSIAGSFRNSLCFGFAIYFFSIIDEYSSPPIVGLLIIVASGICFADTRFKGFLNMRFAAEAIAPLASCSLLPLAFVGPSVITVLCSLILAFSCLFDVLNWTAVSENARTNKVRSSLVFSSDRFGNLLGLGVGLFISYLAFGDSTTGLITPFMPAILVAVIACLHPVIFSGNNSYQFIINEKHGVRQDNENTKKGFWRYRCQRFAEYYRLSPRQLEVLILLAKGRDTNFIEKSLVISGHTAKAHVYGIYSKTNVHSKQELISRIESFEVTDEEMDIKPAR
jgi:DNA-binding CsgD family transcriptional regulator